MFEKHLWKSDVTLPQVQFRHFTSKSQLPGFYISGALVENELSDYQTHNHLVRKRTLKHLAKMASLAKWLSVR